MSKEYLVTSINSKTPINGDISINEFDGDYNNLINKPTIPTNYTNNIEGDFEIGFDDEGVYYQEFELKYLDGRIFYIAENNGIDYKFYDENQNELTDISIDGLANAYYYKKLSNDTTVADKFYVVFDGGYTTGGSGISNTRMYAYGQAIGTGKTNTATIASYATSTSSVWYQVVHEGAPMSTHNNDWYFPSMYEAKALNESHVYEVASTTSMWTSTEVEDNWGFMKMMTSDCKFYNAAGTSYNFFYIRSF